MIKIAFYVAIFILCIVGIPLWLYKPWQANNKKLFLYSRAKVISKEINLRQYWVWFQIIDDAGNLNERENCITIGPNIYDKLNIGDKIEVQSISIDKGKSYQFSCITEITPQQKE